MKKYIGRVCSVLEVDIVSPEASSSIVQYLSTYVVPVVKDDNLVHTKHCCRTGDTSSKLSFELKCFGAIIKSMPRSDTDNKYNEKVNQPLK